MPKKTKKKAKPAKKLKVVKKQAAAKKKAPARKTVKKVKTVKKAKTVKKVKKAKKITAVAKGYSSITPYLIVHNANDAIDFYKKAFGAKEVMRIEKEAGKVGHAELQIGGSKIMLADEHPECNARSAKTIGASPVSIHLYIEKVDDVVDRAVFLGAKLLRAVETMYYGDRSGGVEDPFGHQWYVSTHVEDVSPAEIKKRLAKLITSPQQTE